MDSPELSIVIPALNEAAHIGALLDDLSRQHDVCSELIVADGGSVDGTPALCRSRGAQVVEAPRGRGIQLNRGRARAQAPLLLFLHADSRLEHDGQLAEAVAAWRQAADERVAGHFQLRFTTTGPRIPSLDWYECLSALGRPQTVNGDQGLLIDAGWLDSLGGFHEILPFLEDQDLGHRHLAAGGSWLLLPGRLHTSARRFERDGVRQRSMQNALIMAMFSFRDPLVLGDSDRWYAPPGADSDGLHTWLDTLMAQLATRPLRARLRFMRQLGRYANRQGIWRLFYAVDLRRHGPDAAQVHPCLDAYDRWVARPSDTRALDSLLGVLAMATIAGVRASSRPS